MGFQRFNNLPKNEQKIAIQNLSNRDVDPYIYIHGLVMATELECPAKEFEKQFNSERFQATAWDFLSIAHQSALYLIEHDTPIEVSGFYNLIEGCLAPIYFSSVNKRQHIVVNLNQLYISDSALTIPYKQDGRSRRYENDPIIAQKAIKYIKDHYAKDNAKKEEVISLIEEYWNEIYPLIKSLDTHDEYKYSFKEASTLRKKLDKNLNWKL